VINSIILIASSVNAYHSFALDVECVDKASVISIGAKVINKYKDIFTHTEAIAMLIMIAASCMVRRKPATGVINVRLKRERLFNTSCQCGLLVGGIRLLLFYIC